RGGIGDVVRADDERYVGLGHVSVDVFHFNEAVVGDVGFGEKHVHVAGHASGNGVNGEADVYALLGEAIVKFADFVLRLGDGHAVAGNDDDFAGGEQNGGGFFSAGAAHDAVFLHSATRGLDLAKGAEHDVGE